MKLMSNLAESITPNDVFLSHATVVAERPSLVVNDGTRLTTAKRAASCLVEAQVGDEVLLASSANDAFVMAVLTRAANGPTNVSIDGDLRFEARNGKLSFAAQSDIEMG